MDSNTDLVQQSMAIPFIQYTVEEGFQLNPEAAEFLSQLKGKIGIISVCGKYRTGKSYILNKLFMEQLAEDRRKRGFQVGPTINPCTKGLWIWKELFYAQNDEDKEMPIIIIDTEGLGAFDEDDNHDTKIFLLGLLLSSLLIYNSVGNIDENVLNNLSLVVNLSKSLQIKNDAKAEDADELAEYFPSFLWILRDFALKLIDQDGNAMTQRQYLESALKEQKGTSDAIENKNRIRRLIKHFFKDRDVQTLVRPLEDEKQLQNLNQIKNEDLRPEFVDQIHQLRTKIFKKVKPKILRNQVINGPMLLELAESYIKALNGGKIPTIDNAWNYMQASELERALKEALVEYDQKLVTNIEKNLPMNDDQINQIASKIKTECFQNFRGKHLGDINNQKGQEYIDKMKKQFKQKFEAIKKKNLQVTKDSCTQMLDQGFQQSIKPKLLNSQYKSYSDLKFDLEQLRNEFLLLNPQGINVKEYLYEYLFTKSLQVTEDLVSNQEQGMGNQLRVLQEQLKQAEKDCLRYKTDLNHEKESCFLKIQEGESDRIKYKTENAILTEKLTTARVEVDELRMKLNCEYTEKVQELELQNKIQKDEIRKRESETKDLTNENVKQANEFNKKIALLEQERDFIKSDLQQVKESVQRKDIEAKEVNKTARDKDDKMKSMKQKRKQLEKELADMKAHNSKLEQQLQQEALSPKGNVVDSQQVELMRKELENIRLEKLYLQNQLLNTSSQKDENKKLYETLLNMINTNQVNQQNVQNKENVKAPKDIATTQEMLDRMSHLQSKLLDLEQSNQVLRNFKNLYKAASDIKCSGCHKSFQPILFKGHYLKCNKLQAEQASSDSLRGGERMFIKFIDAEQNGQLIRFFVNYSGVQWYVKRQLSQVIETIKGLASTYHTADFFKSSLYKRLLKLEEVDVNINDLMDKVMSELTSLYVVRKDKEFKNLFEVDMHLSDEQVVQTGRSALQENKEQQPRVETKYVSFMKAGKV